MVLQNPEILRLATISPLPTSGGAVKHPPTARSSPKPFTTRAHTKPGASEALATYSATAFPIGCSGSAGQCGGIACSGCPCTGSRKEKAITPMSVNLVRKLRINASWPRTRHRDYCTPADVREEPGYHLPAGIL